MEFNQLLMNKMNAYLTENMEEQKLEILFNLPLAVSDAQIIDLNLFVMEDEFYGADDVHVFEHTLQITLDNGATIIEKYQHADAEDIETTEYFLPLNESRVEYNVTNGGRRYPELNFSESRERTEEEELGIQLMEVLAYMDFFDNEIKDEWFYHFIDAETKKISKEMLPYMPFVKSLSYHGGSMVHVTFENEMQLTIAEQSLRTEIIFLMRKKENEEVSAIV